MNKKFAICVGNNYPNTSAELYGCVNDARDWGKMLTAQGYEVAVLTEATKGQVVAALRALVALVSFADRIVFTYSGHGTWVPDQDGDEADRRDEALVMADYMQGGLLLDDEIQRIFGNLKYGARALVLSDSCHSGTVSRVMGTATGRGQPRFLSPALFTPVTREQAVALERAPASAPRRTASLISGCTDLEYSYDAWFAGRANGAFTRAALDAFRSGMTLNAWFKDLRQALPNENFPQTPQLTALAYRKYTRAI